MSGVATSHVLDKLRPNEDGKERCAFARSYGVFTHRSMGGMEIQNQNLEKCVGNFPASGSLMLHVDHIYSNR